MVSSRQVVCVVNGEEVNREVDYLQAGEGAGPPGCIGSVAVPVLEEGEEIQWVAGDCRPHIVQLFRPK